MSRLKKGCRRACQRASNPTLAVSSENPFVRQRKRLLGYVECCYSVVLNEDLRKGIRITRNCSSRAPYRDLSQEAR